MLFKKKQKKKPKSYKSFENKMGLKEFEQWDIYTKTYKNFDSGKAVGGSVA